MKIDINLVVATLKSEKLDPAVTRRIVEKLQHDAAGPGKAEPTPRAKQQYSILISDPDNKLAEAGDLVGWVLQLPEEDSPATVVDRIKTAAARHNDSRKGRLTPVNTVGEALESLSVRWFKDEDSGRKLLTVKTRTPVLVVRSDNKL